MRSDSPHLEVSALEEVLRESGSDLPLRRSPGSIVSLPDTAGPQGGLRPLAVQVAEVERQAIEAAMQATGGNKVQAARLLGISRAKLYERLEMDV
jgi:DNA-binding NtrC family response regulator